MFVKEVLRQEVNKELESFTRALKDYQAQKVILFGSFARGDFHEASDLDIIVIKDTSLRFLDRIGEVLSLYPGKHGLEVLVYTPEEFQKMLAEGNPFIRQVMEEGEIIYEQK